MTPAELASALAELRQCGRGDGDTGMRASHERPYYGDIFTDGKTGPHPDPMEIRSCGHPFSIENTQAIGGGRTACRECRRAISLRSWHKRKGNQSRIAPIQETDHG
jgi:hypothetical protein